jgi:hypothetical protein
VMLNVSTIAALFAEIIYLFPFICCIPPFVQ